MVKSRWLHQRGAVKRPRSFTVRVFPFRRLILCAVFCPPPSDMPREFTRADRVSSQIQRVLAELIQYTIKDPRLGFVTVNEVDVSRDLSVAKVYISVLNAEESERQNNLDILIHAAAFLRRELSKQLRMRAVPELRFVYDDSIERGMKMDRILAHLSRDDDGTK